MQDIYARITAEKSLNMQYNRSNTAFDERNIRKKAKIRREQRQLNAFLPKKTINVL